MSPGRARPAATVSVDVDPVDLHLIGYGHPDLPADPLVYDVALPRLVEVFARVGIPATMFVVGRDAATHARALTSLTDAGHEVASHSLTHPIALTRLGPGALERELVESRRLLEAACGADVVGFRAPNFDLDLAGLGALAAAGYRYDASAYPSPMLLPARVLLALKSKDPLGVLRLRLLPFTWEREPQRWSLEGRLLEEFPVSVTPGLRVPVYHTARYWTGDRRFASILDGFVARNEPLSYPLHAVDVLGLREDHVDTRLAGHPGMDRALEAKLALLERSLAMIAERFEVATFRARLECAGDADHDRRASG